MTIKVFDANVITFNEIIAKKIRIKIIINFIIHYKHLGEVITSKGIRLVQEPITGNFK